MYGLAYKNTLLLGYRNFCLAIPLLLCPFWVLFASSSLIMAAIADSNSPALLFRLPIMAATVGEPARPYH
jgi:hypothetical protein